MGKGDKKTKKGKISAGSYGISRKRKKATAIVTPKAKKKVAPKKVEAEKEAAPAKKAAPKKPAAKKTTTKKAAPKKPKETTEK